MTTAAFAHRAFLYGDDDAAAAVVAAELDAAATGGEPVFVALEPGVRYATERLLADGPGAHRAVFVDLDTLWTPSAAAAIEQFLRILDGLDGGGRARTVMTHDLRRRADVDDFSFAAEDAVNRAAADRVVTCTCLYDLRNADPGQVRAARLTHPVLLVDGHELPNPDFRPPDPDAVDRLDLDVDLHGLGGLRDRLRGRAVGVAADVLDDVLLVVTEAVAAVAPDGPPVEVTTTGRARAVVWTVAMRDALSAVDTAALTTGRVGAPALHDLALAVRASTRVAVRVVDTDAGGLLEITAAG